MLSIFAVETRVASKKLQCNQTGWPRWHFGLFEHHREALRSATGIRLSVEPDLLLLPYTQNAVLASALAVASFLNRLCRREGRGPGYPVTRRFTNWAQGRPL